jgi:uncharacterized protein
MSRVTDRHAGTRQSVRENDAKRARRANFIKWLRKSHGWVGLWAMTLTMLFGLTGFLQNHRATIRADAVRNSTVHVALPVVRPEGPEALADFLGTQLKIDRPADRVRREPPKRVPWGDGSVMQPERWEVRFSAPECTVAAEYWKGEDVVEVKRQERGPVGTLEGSCAPGLMHRLHAQIWRGYATSRRLASRGTAGSQFDLISADTRSVRSMRC